MSSKTLLLTLVSLFLVAGALYAPGAQALEAEWEIDTETLSALKLSEEKVTIGGGPISLKVPSLEFTLKCTSVTGSGKILKGGTIELTPSLKECSVTGKSLCKITEPITIEAKGELIETGEHRYYKLFAPNKEKGFTTIILNKSCGLSEEKNTLTGETPAESSLEPGLKQTLATSEAISNTVNKSLEKESKSTLKLTFAKAQAFLEGNIVTELSGGNKGKAFSNLITPSLCQQLVQLCPDDKTYEVGVTVNLENEAPMKFLFNSLVAKCTEAFLGAESIEEDNRLRLGVGTAFFAGCSTNTDPNCTALMTGQPYNLAIMQGGQLGSGFLWLRAATPISIKFECDGLKCIYEPRILTVPLQGGMPAKVHFSEVPITKLAGSDAGCDPIGTWQGEGGTIKYKISTPSPLYLAL